MNSKSNNPSNFILYSCFVLSVVLYYVALSCSVGVGNFAGKYISSVFINMAVNVGAMTGIIWVWPSLVYGALTFLFGITILIILVWRVFLKNIKKGPFPQLTLVNFVRRLLSFSAIGFFVGFTWFSFDLVSSMVDAISRLPR